MRVLAFAGLALALVVPAPLRAGDVVVVAKGGKLAVKGTDDPDLLTFGAAGQGLQITPGAGTTVNGAGTPQIFIVTGKITIDLGAGDDELAFDGAPAETDLNVKLGDGLDVFRFENSSIGGKTTIDLGPGPGSVSLCNVAAAKAVTIKGGVVGLGNTEAGCVGVDNAEAFGLDGTAIVFGNFNVAGNLAVKLKTGNATVVAANSGTLGKASFAFGDGTTLLGLCDAGVGQSLGVTMRNGTVSRSLQCTLGTSTLTTNAPHAVILGGVQVGGSVTIKGGKDTDVVTMGDAAIGEKMKLALSDGDNGVFALNTLIGTSFTLTTGKGTDLFSTPAFTVGESAKLSVGAGANVVDLGNSTIGENLTVKAGDGDDTITTDQVVVGGTKTIKPGGGTNTVP
jgi:hypothetical protein